jgi:hypothetical protein
MQVLGSASREDLILAWLKSEWDAPPPRPAGRRLIDRPDLTDAAENEARKMLLYRDRGKILQEIPGDAEHVWVLIGQADLPPFMSSRARSGIWIPVAASG